MSRQIPDLKRKVAKRKPKRTFYLICEGARTEKDYFTALSRVVFDSLIDIKITAGAGVPLTIATKAKATAKEYGLLPRSRARKDSYEDGDQVWAVFDRDEFDNYNEAISLCQDNGIRIARSNPCFEVWLILHFRDYDVAEHRHRTQEVFEGLCNDYDRNSRKTTDCSKLMELIKGAEERASRQLERRDEEGGKMNPPSTTVHELTRAIRGLDVDGHRASGLVMPT